MLQTQRACRLEVTVAGTKRNAQTHRACRLEVTVAGTKRNAQTHRACRLDITVAGTKRNAQTHRACRQILWLAPRGMPSRTGLVTGRGILGSLVKGMEDRRTKL